jgi:hypothetical protein
MFLLISISSEAFCKMMTMRLLRRRLGIGASTIRDATESLRRVRGSFGGRLVLVDWAKGEVLADKPILGVSGLAVRDGTIAASSWIEPSVRIFQDGNEVCGITHHWFNYVHSVELTSARSILVASAGSDLVAEVTFEGAIAWHWFGPEHGYSLRPDGAPAFFDRAADYRSLRTSTEEQAMHVNSATVHADSVLATLFHQGALISISRDNGAARVVLDGLTWPHGVHPRAGGFVLSDTLGHRIILLDQNLQVCDEIPFGGQWLQDTIATSAGTYLTLENVRIDQLPVPNLRNRIVEVDGAGRRLRTVDVDVDCRLFTAREIDQAHARALIASWGASRDFSAWRWE